VTYALLLGVGCGRAGPAPGRPLSSFRGEFIQGDFCGQRLWIRRKLIRRLTTDSHSGWYPGTLTMSLELDDPKLGPITVYMGCYQGPSRPRWRTSQALRASPWERLPGQGLDRRSTLVAGKPDEDEYRPWPAYGVDADFRLRCQGRDASAHCHSFQDLPGIGLEVHDWRGTPQDWRAHLEFPAGRLGVGPAPPR